MDLKSILSAITPEIRETLATAVETGRWANGSKLTDSQRASAIQAIIAWDAKFGEVTNEPFKVQKGGVFNHKIDK